jgi:predicted O-methyltransferase YrrM
MLTRYKQLALKALAQATRGVEADTRDRHNVDLVLAEALARAESQFPVAYIETLRGCIERLSLATVSVKAPADETPKGFRVFVDALRNLPVVPLAVAESVAQESERYRRNNAAHAHPMLGDVSAGVDVSSSFGMKGRILSAAVRFLRPRDGLELGTAWGLSAMFLMEASETLRLTTVERGELEHGLASAMLTKRYGDRVTCLRANSQEALASLPPASVDLVFHDAGHTRADYVNDFRAMLPALRPGAVVLMDDIRWPWALYVKENPHVYEGWRDIVAHPRVAEAVEISDSLGVVRVA